MTSTICPKTTVSQENNLAQPERGLEVAVKAKFAPTLNTISSVCEVLKILERTYFGNVESSDR